MATDLLEEDVPHRPPKMKLRITVKVRGHCEALKNLLDTEGIQSSFVRACHDRLETTLGQHWAQTGEGLSDTSLFLAPLQRGPRAQGRGSNAQHERADSDVPMPPYEEIAKGEDAAGEFHIHPLGVLVESVTVRKLGPEAADAVQLDNSESTLKVDDETLRVALHHFRLFCAFNHKHRNFDRERGGDFPALFADGLGKRISAEVCRAIRAESLSSTVANLVKRYTDEVSGTVFGPGTGAFFYGPPGCGKSTLATAIKAGGGFAHAQVVTPSDFESMYYGKREQKLAAIFSRCRVAPWLPFLVVVEEGDALAPNRGAGTSSGHDVRLTTTLLAYFKGSKVDSRNLFLIVTSNAAPSEATFDPALLDRLELRLYFPIPVLSERIASFNAAMARLGLSSDTVQRDKLGTYIAERTLGFSHRAIGRFLQSFEAKWGRRSARVSVAELDDHIDSYCRQFHVTFGGNTVPELLSERRNWGKGTGEFFERLKESLDELRGGGCGYVAFNVQDRGIELVGANGVRELRVDLPHLPEGVPVPDAPAAMVMVKGVFDDGCKGGAPLNRERSCQLAMHVVLSLKLEFVVYADFSTLRLSGIDTAIDAALRARESDVPCALVIDTTSVPDSAMEVLSQRLFAQRSAPLHRVRSTPFYVLIVAYTDASLGAFVDWPPTTARVVRELYRQQQHYCTTCNDLYEAGRLCVTLAERRDMHRESFVRRFHSFAVPEIIAEALLKVCDATKARARCRQCPNFLVWCPYCGLPGAATVDKWARLH